MNRFAAARRSQAKPSQPAAAPKKSAASGCGSQPSSASKKPIVNVRITKGFRGLGVTTDVTGVVVELDPNCPAALAGELNAGDRVVMLEMFDMPPNTTLEDAIAASSWFPGEALATLWYSLGERLRGRCES